MPFVNFLVILYVLSIGTFPFLEDSRKGSIPLSWKNLPSRESCDITKLFLGLAELVKQGLSNTHFVQLSSLSVLLGSIIKRYSIVFISDPHLLWGHRIHMVSAYNFQYRCLEINPLKRITSTGILIDRWIFQGPTLRLKPNTEVFDLKAIIILLPNLIFFDIFFRVGDLTINVNLRSLPIWDKGLAFNMILTSFLSTLR